MSAKEEEIDKGADNGLMNLFVFGKADGFTAKPFDACTQSKVDPIVKTKFGTKIR